MGDIPSPHVATGNQRAETLIASRVPGRSGRIDTVHASWPPWTDPGRYLRSRFPHATTLKFGPSPRGEEPPSRVLGLKFREGPIPLPSERKVLVADLPGSPTLGVAFGIRLGAEYGRGAWVPTRSGAGRRMALRTLGLDPSHDRVWTEVLAEFGALASYCHQRELMEVAEQRLAQLCAVIAWYQEVDVSGGGALAGSPIATVGPDASLDDLLGIVPGGMVVAISKLMALAAEHLPDPAVCRDVQIEPRCGSGQADLLLDGLLLEVKTVRTPSISSDYAYQLLGYLLGLHPSLSADRVGWYFARHGILWDFDIADFIEIAAGEPVALDVAQSEFRAVGG